MSKYNYSYFKKQSQIYTPFITKHKAMVFVNRTLDIITFREYIEKVDRHFGTQIA